MAAITQNPQSPFSFGIQPQMEPMLSQPAFAQPQVAAPQHQQGNIWQLIAQLLQGGGAQQQMQNNTPANLAALRNDPQGDANKGYVPGVANQYNPFSNGFFNPASSQPHALANPPPLSPPSHAMPQRPAPQPFVPPAFGLTGPNTPQNDAEALAAYKKQVAPGGMAQARNPFGTY